MGQVSQMMLEIMEQCDTYQEACERLDDCGLLGDKDMVLEMWLSMQEDYSG